MWEMKLWKFVLLASIIAVIVVGAKNKKDGEGQIQRQDLEFLKCDICKRVSTQLTNAILDARRTRPRNIVGEFEIVQIMDNVCKPKNLTTGAWTRQLDIIESIANDGKKFLELSEPGGKQNCNRECATLAKSCDSLLEAEIDADDLSAYLYRSQAALDNVEEKLCKKLTKRCVGTKKALPANHQRVNEDFSPMDERQEKAEELTAMMREAGVQGDLKRREDMAEMMEDYAEDFNPYDDDEYGDALAQQQRSSKPFAPPGYAKNSHINHDDDL